MKRKTCSVKGCKNLARNKGFQRGHKRYDRLCYKHHEIKHGKDDYFKIKNDYCENCGWNLAPCDRHRIKPEKGYFRYNVISLCPNCHRLMHFRPELIDTKKILQSRIVSA